MKKLLIILILLTLAVVALFYQSRSSHQKLHYHAGFLLYLNGVKQDFSDFKYMKYEKCGVDSDSSLNEQLEKAHLHDGVGDVVHVHRSHAIWQDLFTNLNYPLPSDLPITGYLNGQKVDDILSLPIMPNTSVVILIGDSPQINLNDYVSLEHIQAVEAQSENCGN